MKDAVGNELRVGDLVVVQIATPVVFGRIVELNEGGIVTGINHKGSSDVRPARILVESVHTIDADPRTLVRSVMALREDGREKQDEKSGEGRSLEALN